MLLAATFFFFLFFSGAVLDATGGTLDVSVGPVGTVDALFCCKSVPTVTDVELDDTVDDRVAGVDSID